MVLGTKGRASLIEGRNWGEKSWTYDGPKKEMYDAEHRELFEAVRSGKPVNDGHYMCLSSLLAVAAQIACYSGQAVSWDDVLKSRRSFALPRYGWDATPPVLPGPDGRYPSPVPGKDALAVWQIG
jgi:hypothetical protein